MATNNVTTPYDAAKKLIPVGNLPTWLNDYDAARYASYGLYEDIYWTEPGSFKLQQRGKEDNPIYIPSGRIMVNTINRYTARSFAVIVDPLFGTDSEKEALTVFFQDFFKRERLGSRHKTNKLYGIMRGDSFWYITANPEKAAGQRVSLRPIDPRMIFPINPKTDVDRVIGYDIVEQTVEGDTTYISRTRYLKPEHPDHPQTGNAAAGISWQVDLLEVEDWETEPKIFKTVTPVAVLPPTLKMPIYHCKNLEEPGNPFGRSEMSGLERVMAAINQSITDEELSLALQGIGMFKSGKGQPRNAAGALVPWVLGPGKVVHDDTFERVSGVSTVSPFQDHVTYLEERINRVNGTSDVAQGVVSVEMAESGVALGLRLGPILDAAADKNTLIQEVYDNLLFDLLEWFRAYDQFNPGGARLKATFFEGLPKNNKERFDELIQMVSADPPLITMAYFRSAVRELGHDIPADVNGAAIAEELASMSAAGDEIGGRLDEEIDGAEAGAEAPEED